MGTLYMSEENIKKIEKSKKLQEKVEQWNNSEIDTIGFLMELNKNKSLKENTI